MASLTVNSINDTNQHPINEGNKHCRPRDCFNGCQWKQLLLVQSLHERLDIRSPSTNIANQVSLTTAHNNVLLYNLAPSLSRLNKIKMQSFFVVFLISSKVKHRLSVKIKHCGSRITTFTAILNSITTKKLTN